MFDPKDALVNPPVSTVGEIMVGSNVYKGPSLTLFGKSMRLLFLDIDGVVNSERTRAVSGFWPDHNAFHKEGESYLMPFHINGFDPIAVRLVNRICQVTGAFIVLCSAWRKSFSSLTDTIKMLAEIGIDEAYVIGRTTNHGFHRGQQIDHFLQLFNGELSGIKKLVEEDLILPMFLGANQVGSKEYVILDDLEGEAVMAEQEPYTVEVNQTNGLTIEEALKACRILTSNVEFELKDFRVGGKIAPGYWN